MPIELARIARRWMLLWNTSPAAPQAISTPEPVPLASLPQGRGIRRRVVPRRRLWRRRGFTLLEIILSLAILAGALAALGEVIRSATQNATESRELTKAQLLASSIMSEFSSGAAALQEVDRQAVDIDEVTPWVYSVEWTPTFEENLVAVRVTVVQDLEAEKNPVQYSLVRWMPDPGLTLTETTSSSSTQ